MDPSSSLYAIREQPPDSWETSVRFVRLSVKRIGSSVVIDVMVELTSRQVGGEVEKSTRSVWRPAWYIVLPVAQSAPIDGSPASMPSPPGAG